MAHRGSKTLSAFRLTRFIWGGAEGITRWCWIWTAGGSFGWPTAAGPTPCASSGGRCGAAVAENLPEAAIVFDRFHIVKLVNEKLDDLRREMVREATGLMKKTVKGIRYLLLMRRENVREEKLPLLEEALKHNEPLFTGYLLKETLGLLWEQPTYGQMRSFLHQWCAWADESGIPQMRQMARTLLSHRSGILSWWKHRINNGRMEGINNKIKTLLRQTYGLRDERYLVLRLLSLHNSRQELLG